MANSTVLAQALVFSLLNLAQSSSLFADQCRPAGEDSGRQGEDPSDLQERQPTVNRQSDRRAGVFTDRLNAKQMKIWRAMERIVLAKDSLGRLLYPELNSVYRWAMTSSIPIHIEMAREQNRWAYTAGECLFDKQPDSLSNSLTEITVRLYLTAVDQAPGRRIPGEQGFLPFEGLKGEKRYCETLAHELFHARQAISHPKFLEMAAVQESLNQELLQLVPLLQRDKESARKEMMTIRDRLNLLSDMMEGPAIAFEQQVWKELQARR
ncbi:MAG: hypothetical protein EHM23_01510 [Acidobacteria bacterium]|nr:MAG: hypothetical protein EHM23_08965 [Acidobacteriota bacterium]RPJ63703.1 MAG: hypothetical protein EHM23_01510 [Acidobacteriota bacterium]